MSPGTTISRKRFIAIIGYVVSILFSGLWVAIVRRTRALEPSSSITIPLVELSGGVTIIGKIIVFREGGLLRIFSSRCSHLGCMISELKDDKLVCPCHGSVFDGRSGAVLEGPAVHPLQELNYEILDENTVSILTGN